jgi:polysaccharide biosynthesis transport protein
LALIKYLKPGHPDVVRLEEQIESAKQLQQNFADEIVKEMRSRENTLNRQLGSLDKQIEEKQKEAIELGGKLAEHERLEEEFRATKLAHDQMFERVYKSFKTFKTCRRTMWLSKNMPLRLQRGMSGLDQTAF